MSLRARLTPLAALLAPAVALALALAPGAARASSGQESIFQDDDHLIYASTATVQHTLDVLKSLGVDRVRVTIKWSAIAPDPLSDTRPAHFTETDPAAYPAANWVPYDRIIELAEAHGIGVDFNVTAPGPLWAMKSGAPIAKEADHYAPSVADYQSFVFALGVRYSGQYIPPASPKGPPANGKGSGLPPIPLPGGLPTLARERRIGGPAADPATLPIPRVHYWTIWNEPNVDGWLAPQWRTVEGRTVPNAPRLYREYVAAGFQALADTGHTVPRDTILIGETAPEGYTYPTAYPEMQPMPFLRALYCVDSHYHQLEGDAASVLGCPISGSRAAFVAANPGLFQATGFAHHPYFFFFPPNYISDNTGFVPIANLSRLEGGLDRIFRLYRVNRKLALYLTEYGYQTNPPDPLIPVSPAQQASYINQADYIAYRDPRVRSVDQFLLYDAPPPYSSTFQTGLLYESGRAKPAFAAYRLPIWTPARRIRAGTALPVWGQLRPARRHTPQVALIQWAPSRGSFRTIASVQIPASSREDYFFAGVHIPASGRVRFAWRPPSGSYLFSRAAPVAVG